MKKRIMNLISSGGCRVVFLMFVESVFPPIPSEFIMPLAGSSVSKDNFSLSRFRFEL